MTPRNGTATATACAETVAIARVAVEKSSPNLETNCAVTTCFCVYCVCGGGRGGAGLLTHSWTSMGTATVIRQNPSLPGLADVVQQARSLRD